MPVGSVQNSVNLYKISQTSSTPPRNDASEKVQSPNRPDDAVQVEISQRGQDLLATISENKKQLTAEQEQEATTNEEIRVEQQDARDQINKEAYTAAQEQAQERLDLVV